MDQLTIERIKLSHPDKREILKSHYIECNNLLPKGVRLRFSQVFRTPGEQDKLFNQRPKVTKARAWQSIHNYGLAFDYVILLDKDNNGTFESIEWNIENEYHQEVINFFKSKGYEWGGDWKRFKDYPHFQFKKNNGSSYNWQELKNKIDSNIILRNNNVVYPKL